MNVEKLVKVMEDSGFRLINSPRGKEFVPKPGRRILRIPLEALESLDKAPAKKAAKKKAEKKVEPTKEVEEKVEK